MRIHLPQGRFGLDGKVGAVGLLVESERLRAGRRAAGLMAMLLALLLVMPLALPGVLAAQSLVIGNSEAGVEQVGVEQAGVAQAGVEQVGVAAVDPVAGIMPEVVKVDDLPDAPSFGVAVMPGISMPAISAVAAKPGVNARDEVAAVRVENSGGDNLLPSRDASFSSTMDWLAAGREGAAGGGASSGGIGPPARPYVPLNECPFDQTHARECRVHVKDLVIESSLFLAFQNTGNLYTGYWYRYETTTGAWWDRYVNSVEGWRWKNWSDNNPFLDDYVGHPIMGAITDSLWIQNDPKGMTLEQSNSWAYYRSRLRALAFSTFYSFEWKLGPIGEASVGHNGDHYFEDKGGETNETGWVELVTTPVGGLGWTLAEDALDRHLIRRLEEKSRNPLLLTVYQFLTPSKAFTNILRFRPPWYRDSRNVKASSFFSDPGRGMTATTAAEIKYVSAHPEAAADMSGGGAGAVVRVPVIVNSPVWEGPGGKHEFGAVWGLSVMTGHVFGYASDVKYMPITLRYSYELYRYRQAWTLRYAPELTALAMIDWPSPQAIGKGLPGTVFNQRQRAYGSGISPVGFEADFRPLTRFQPFFRMDGGFIYFDERVLSPEGSQWMYTIGPDVGFNIYRHERQTVTLGWRYTHLSNADISLHNPGTDANVFYVGISRFRNKGEATAPVR